jgi:hypothetical protein
MWRQQTYLFRSTKSLVILPEVLNDTRIAPEILLATDE